MLKYLHAVRKLAVSFAVSKANNTAVKVKGINVEFFKRVRCFCIYA